MQHTTYDAQTASENAEEQPEAVEKPTLAALAAETAGVDAETILGEDLVPVHQTGRKNDRSKGRIRVVSQTG